MAKEGKKVLTSEGVTEGSWTTWLSLRSESREKRHVSGCCQGEEPYYVEWEGVLTLSKHIARVENVVLGVERGGAEAAGHAAVELQGALLSGSGRAQQQPGEGA